jgi:hypothetical protein
MIPFASPPHVEKYVSGFRAGEGSDQVLELMTKQEREQ